MTNLGHVKAETEPDGRLILPAAPELFVVKYEQQGVDEWIVPDGVTKVFVSGCGGGGAGHNSSGSYKSTAGGITSFGTQISLSGGGAGSGQVSKGGGKPGGFGGSYGGVGSVDQTPAQYSVGKVGGIGGSSLFGVGGVPTTSMHYSFVEPTNGTGFGSGGAGFLLGTSSYSGDWGATGGGGGECCIDKEIATVPGERVQITIGSAGIYREGNYLHGYNGTGGLLIIKYSK
ncbi:Uncharacterised protein [Lysinibacillus sphaericus]|nr:Uncharacterised protein [Lysinibacillus sphaericus]